MWEWREHTAEVELWIEAGSLDEVFADGLAALGEVVAGEAGGEPARHQVRIEAADTATLLADWLNELVYLADARSFVPERLGSLALEGAALDASIEGRHGDVRRLVKAVTYHRLELVQEGASWRARVVLDV